MIDYLFHVLIAAGSFLLGFASGLKISQIIQCEKEKARERKLKRLNRIKHQIKKRALLKRIAARKGKNVSKKEGSNLS